MFAFVGSQTSGAGEGISVFPYDENTGEFDKPTVYRDTINPTFLEIDPARSMLYAVQEADVFGGLPGGGLAAYSLTPGRDGVPVLTPAGVRRSMGTYPCHVVLGPAAKALYVSNYGDGTLSAFSLDKRGVPGEAVQVFHYSGHGPDATRQECAHVHSVFVMPDGRCILAADLGRDALVRYPIDSVRGDLIEAEELVYSVTPGSGPRHFAHHAGTTCLYVVEELSSELTALRWNRDRGTLDHVMTVSTLAGGFHGSNLASDVHLHPNGRYLYCSNRGADTIARFGVAEGSESLTPLGQTPCGGAWPRNFAIDPAGRYMHVANSRSDSIAQFRIDAGSGALEPIGPPVPVGEPMCIKFAKL
jgi:6-phosphogluconolactonase